jgi:hypothetical protein
LKPEVTNYLLAGSARQHSSVSFGRENNVFEDADKGRDVRRSDTLGEITFAAEVTDPLSIG